MKSVTNAYITGICDTFIVLYNIKYSCVIGAAGFQNECSLFYQYQKEALNQSASLNANIQ